MKAYHIDSVFTFGKFEGKSLNEVIEFQPTYLDWCIVNLDHFFIPEENLEKIKSLHPMFHLSKEAEVSNTEKISDWYSQMKEEENNYEDWGSEDDHTDWTHYNDDLDMDQQSLEFWNQF